MQTFLQEVASHILENHPLDLDRVTVIFPNRRAGLFFRKAMGELIDQPVWMPHVTSLEDFILRNSTLQKVETLEGILRLYDVYKAQQPRDESFDQFFFWGEMILRDFEEIDQYLAEPDHLFTSIKTQKELDEEFYFLDEEELKIIRSFWSTFLPEASKTQQAFLETWKILNPIYHEFRQQLAQTHHGYGGQIYRAFLDRLEADELTFTDPIHLAGFNALTPAEENIIKILVEQHSAAVHWDLDQHYLEDEQQEAGYFLRSYQQDTILGKTFPDTIPNQINEKKDFLAIGVSLEVGQAKALADHLKQLTTSPDFIPEQTVIVLPNEYMLFPLLHAIPPEIDQLNITMGFPMKDTPVFSLLESLLQLQGSVRESVVHGRSFYHRPVIEILGHPLIQPIAGEEGTRKTEEITKRNLIFIYQVELQLKQKIFSLIFGKPIKPLQYLLEVLRELHQCWKAQGHDIELEFISRFYQHTATLEAMIGEKTEQLSYDFLIRLFRRLARSLKVPFTGEPLEGLQVMGVLETRNLDFENVFILNMNEGSWPAPPKKGSFIPYNIRKAFDLPVFEHQDSIYAYLFYRLLQKANRVWFYYNTVSEFNVNGEISRYIQQLAYETDHKIEKRILANPISPSPSKAITIEKTPEVLLKLRRFEVSAGEWTPRLTPSALDTYLYCRLRFYFKYVQELYEPDELQEELNPMVFGNILHDAMEILYKQFLKKNKTDIIAPNDFFGLDGGVDVAINRAFIKHYDVKNETKFKLEGRNIIAAEIIRKTILKILQFDQQYAPFKVLGLETSTRDGYTVDFPIEVEGAPMVIGIKGKIDRLDMKQGRVRVIDYKTGKDAKEFSNINSLIDRDDPKRNKAAFQVFFYSYLFYKTYRGSYEAIEPGLFNSRDLFDQDFNWQLKEKAGRQTQVVTEFRDYLEPFENLINTLLTEIYDPAVPFDQVTDDSKCRFCPYKEICGKG